MSGETETTEGIPDVAEGIEYWGTQPATYNGVLGKPPRSPTRLISNITVSS